ncbi:MAG: hypothetical protein CMD99_05055 [Gammaproteobacteria bacterium]|nr:hypothetical protein [Gammaproteobacteria bacterium]|tara:strand:- start:14474 stop:14686 length:213 start_codon:yes stop_codon:yes gene_type:complete
MFRIIALAYLDGVRQYSRLPTENLSKYIKDDFELTSWQTYFMARHTPRAKFSDSDTLGAMTTDRKDVNTN